MNDAKHPITSKTIWLNIASVVGGAALCFMGNVAAGGPMVVSGLTNIALRLTTTQPISLNP